MNRICKVILAAAAVLALAAPAMAVDKLIVNNTNGTAGFKVDDTGPPLSRTSRQGGNDRRKVPQKTYRLARGKGEKVR